MTARQDQIAQLRAGIDALEKRPALQGLHVPAVMDRAVFGGLPGGLLHEVWADTHNHAGSLLGFTLGQAQDLLSLARPALIWLALAEDGQEAGLPYAAGLQRFGLTPEQMIIGRMKSMTDLLWAAEEALACPAVAAVMVEAGHGHKILDFTATRRLSLRAQMSGASLFLMRTGMGRETTAAAFRWHVAPAPGAAAAFDERAPQAPRFAVRLEKGQGNRRDVTWQLDWTENGFGDAQRPGPDRRRGPAALSGADVAALGDRLPQTA